MRFLLVLIAAGWLSGAAIAATGAKQTVPAFTGPLFSVGPDIAIPDREREYVAIVEKARKSFRSAKSVDGRRAARSALQIDVHNFMGLAHTAKDWVGVFRQSSTLPDGRRSLEIEIAPGVSVETWDNTYSDRTYDTLIKAYSPVAKMLGDFSIGQPVMFSANLLGGVISTDEDMVLQPRVIARFSDLKILDTPPPAAK